MSRSLTLAAAATVVLLAVPVGAQDMVIPDQNDSIPAASGEEVKRLADQAGIKGNNVGDNERYGADLKNNQGPGIEETRENGAGRVETDDIVPGGITGGEASVTDPLLDDQGGGTDGPPSGGDAAASQSGGPGGTVD